MGKKNSCAVGVFNTFNLETTLGIVEGAQKARSPVIIAVSETTIQYAGLKPITHIVKTIAKNKAVDIPVALHLDHGKHFSSVVECIQAGFSSIMIDASDLPLEENIKITKQAVDYAHKHHVWAQGEIGRVVREVEEIKRLIINPEEFLTRPQEAVVFVKKTGVDTLAVATGNVHGFYKMKEGVPKLNLERLKKINQAIKSAGKEIPLVLHGASGVAAEEIKKAINFGIVIINIDTEIRIAIRQALSNALNQEKSVDPRKIMLPVIRATAEVVENKIKIFSQGKHL